jgi:methanesulfonate monooxygenase large subunit
VQYGEFELGESREELSFPHLPPNQWYMIDLFPGMNFNLRGSALRTDVVTPLGPNSVMIEFRGFGLKKDTPEERKTRIEHHNTIWGPMGRNLHEDLLGITGQGVSMAPGTEHRHILHGRHEDDTIHDEIGMRHFYNEWSNWMGIDPANPMRENAIYENNE